MKVVNSDSNKVYLFRKGINTNEPSIQIYGRKQTLRLLIDTTSSPNGYPFTFGNLLDKDEYPTGDNPYTPKWMHFALVAIGREFKIYIDGGIKRKFSHKINADPIYEYSPLKLGGYDGYIKDCKFANYAMTQNEVVSVMGSHPDTTVNKTLKTMFREYCKEGTPFNIDEQPDNMSDEKKLYKAPL